MSENRKKPLQLKINLSDEVAQGMYINLVMVNHTESEFVVDGLYVQPQQPKAHVRSRLILSPRHTKRLLMALQDNLDRYEDRFGEIELKGPNPADQLLQ